MSTEQGVEPRYSYDRTDAALRCASLLLIEHKYGQWKDETGRWAVDRIRGETEQFTARDRRGRWKQTYDSLSAALEALQQRARNDVRLQMEHYSYERQP